ncbi:MAG: MucR family transcriptional regulator [Nitrospirota bacterium]
MKASKKRFSGEAPSAPDSAIPQLRNRRSSSAGGRGDGVPDELAELRARPVKSIQNRYVVNLEDGRKYRMLTSRTLARFGLTPREYRVKWGLPLGQPLLAKSLLVTRRKTARELGLGERLRAAQRRGTPSGPVAGRAHEKIRKQAPKKRRGRERSNDMARRGRPLTR